MRHLYFVFGVLLSCVLSASLSAQSCLIYVTPTGLAVNPGTQASPTSIVQAFAIANANPNTHIILSTGTFNISNPLNLTGEGTILEGGHNPSESWRKTSLAGATVINRTTANPEGVFNARRLVAIYVNGASGFRFQDVSIFTSNANQFGMSTYGIHMTSCANYSIVRTQIFPGNAAMGSAGIAGASGMPGGNGGLGSAGNDSNANASGNGGGGGGGGGVNAGGNGGNAFGNLPGFPGAAGLAGFGGGGGGGQGAGNPNCMCPGSVGIAGSCSTNLRAGGGGGTLRAGEPHPGIGSIAAERLQGDFAIGSEFPRGQRVPEFMDEDGNEARHEEQYDSENCFSRIRSQRSANDGESDPEERMDQDRDAKNREADHVRKA